LRHFIFAAEIKNYTGTTKYQDNRPDNEGDWVNDWSGNAIEVTLGLRAGNMPFAWDFLVKAGYDKWERDMDYDMNEASRDVRTNKQIYAVRTLRYGTGPTWRVRRWYASVIAGIKKASGNVTAPTEDSYYEEEVKFDLDGETTYFLNFNNHIRLTKRLSLIIHGYFDAYHFKRTDTKVIENRNPPNTTSNATNPESEQHSFGIQGGVSVDF
jgi:hypothetical protein